KTAIDSARNHFEQVIDPTLIDCYIYELNAAQLRYQFLLRRFKSREV
ncbi:YaaL family protein, partial [Anaerotignum faecicola]|nr:YaaL family protein [Anaerotignum faecicola]